MADVSARNRRPNRDFTPKPGWNDQSLWLARGAVTEVMGDTPHVYTQKGTGEGQGLPVRRPRLRTHPTVPARGPSVRAGKARARLARTACTRGPVQISGEQPAARPAWPNLLGTIERSGSNQEDARRSLQNVRRQGGWDSADPPPHPPRAFAHR